MPTADFRYTTGVIGNYQGKEVYSISEKDFDLSRNRRSNSIAAVTFGDSYEIRLIDNGKWIGNMDPQGHVELFKKARSYEKRVKLDDYTFEEVKGSKTKVTEDTAASADSVAAKAAASQKRIDEFLHSESVVDKYLKEMGYRVKK